MKTYFRIIISLVIPLSLLSACNYDKEDMKPGVSVSSGSLSFQTGAMDPSKIPTNGKNAEAVKKLEILVPEKVDKSPLLINNLGTFEVYLMDKNGETLYKLPLGGRRLGNDVTLLTDGTVFASLQSTTPKIILGGFGGKTAFIKKNGDIAWEYELSNAESISHHDAEILPNGNILLLVWDKIDKSVSKEFGYKLPVNIYPERIVEIDPKTNTVVWEWNSVYHLIQDVDPALPDYGDVSKNPGRINMNQAQSQSGMIMHANGLTYDAKNDLIYVSVYNFSEVWAIDHSTTRDEAKTAKGGKFNRGGDLVYRFGNPSAYGGTGTRLFFSSHHPSFTNSGTFLIYSNGIKANPEQSSVYEFKLPDDLDKKTPTLEPPEILWSYTNPEIYFDKVGGASIAPNGNVIITEGDGCIWEVTREKEVVWKYCMKPAMFWRTYVYPYGSPELKALGIEQK